RSISPAAAPTSDARDVKPAPQSAPASALVARASSIANARLSNAPSYEVASIDFGHEALARLLWPLISGVRLAWWNFDLHGPHIVIGYLCQQMRDAIEPRPFLVVGVDDVPGRLLAIGMGEHLVLGLRILDPVLA